MITHDPRRSLPRGNTLVPSRWQATVLSVTGMSGSVNICQRGNVRVRAGG
jgi:hypothetical protein